LSGNKNRILVIALLGKRVIFKGLRPETVLRVAWTVYVIIRLEKDPERDEEKLW